MIGGRPVRAFLFLPSMIPLVGILVSIIPLVYIGGKILGKKERASDPCGSSEKEGVAEPKAVEDEAAGSSTAKHEEQGSFDYDVFINFRGKDTRNGFTTHLYEKLKNHGIITFIDNEGLKAGQRMNELLNCIERSKIFMPVFSESYADSKPCLREIAKMVEINKKEGDQRRPIIPIFYDVCPCDVKHCTASIKKAFRKHRRDKKVGRKQINEWKAALKEAGSIAGFRPSQTGGNEAKLIRRIRRRVSSILSDTGVEKGSACMTGTSGVGGVGKTPSMMALCKELSPAFDGICFPSNIRQTEDGEGLLPLQLAKLLNEILRKNTTVGNAGQGVSLTEQRLGSKKLPFISDEILNRTCQLGFFTADRGKREEWFNGGSQINIVKTRNKEALPCHGLQEVGIYFPKELDGEQLLQLFFHHASSSSQELPPALILFGSPLGLEALKSDQHENVQELRRISYRSLEPWAKCAFLDIACFFIGQKKEYSVYMWVACGYPPGIAHQEEGNAKVSLEGSTSREYLTVQSDMHLKMEERFASQITWDGSVRNSVPMRRSRFTMAGMRSSVSVAINPDVVLWTSDLVAWTLCRGS
ncbi:disease resistance protein L6-like [Nymphaea colorata]|nr:disease resistance protein L6-like [Nymphaea colorata]